jgi:hypothetical protein
LGIALAWYGFGLVAGGDTFATYRLRDGLIVALVGALIFAWNTLPFAPLPFSGGERQWPLWGRICAGTAIICGAAAAVLLALWGEQSWATYLGGSLWGVSALALLVGLFWPGRIEIYPAPAFRWRVDAAGNYVRYALDDPTQPADSSSLHSSWRHPFYFVLVIALLGIGVLLRVWHLTTLPATCVDIECALALRLVEGGWPRGFQAEALSLFALLARVIYHYSGESISALRWSGAILGSLTLPVIYWAARATMKPAGALVALLVMALLPWAVWSSRFGTVWSAAPLLIALAMGMAGRALHYPNYRWWGMTGVALALLLMQPLPIWGATLGWIVVLAGAAVWAQAQMPGQTERASRRAWIDHAALMVGAALALGLPLALPLWRATLAAGTVETNNNAIGLLSLVAGLLDSGGAPLNYFTNHPLLPLWAAALTLAGLLTFLRWTVSGKASQPRAAAMAAGMLLYGVIVLLVIPFMGVVDAASASAPSTRLMSPAVSADQVWLVLLPFVALASGLAADQWFTSFNRAWSILLPLPRVVMVVALVLVVLAGRETLTLMGQLGRAGGSAQNETEVAMAQYLASCLRGEAVGDPCSQPGQDDQQGVPVFYLPAAAVNHPSARLLLGAALESGRVRPFDPSRDLLPSTTPTGDLFYLVGLDNQPVIDLLHQLYPGARLHAEPTDRIGPTLFLVIQIPLADVLSHQGLAGQYYAGMESTGTAVETRLDGPLRFAWSSDPPLDGPFNVLWQGSLIVPEAGSYLFAIDSNTASGPDAPVISLQLDGSLVLDSSLGLTEKNIMLAQGAYQLTLRYRTTGAAADWALRWTPPGGAPQEIARQQLYSPPLPNIGLIGTYYAGSHWDGATLTTRKDMVLGTSADLPEPYSIYWTGKLAAARAGEYFFAVTANGPVTLSLDGRDTLFHTPSPDLATGPGYSQASIYLEQGWHTLDLRYAPANTSDLRVLWQPPGSGPLLLAGRYLLPTQAPITMSDVPLPPAPELMDARLGNDHFALSANMEPYQPVHTLPPTNLPLLVSEPVWTLANGCGADTFQFASPRGIAVDAQNGRLYVADTGNRRIEELALSDGSPITTYALPEFQEPVDVAIDPGGALLILDATVQNIFRIDRATGESAAMASGTSFYHPRGFAVDRAGNIAVADTGGARVVVLDATGTLLSEFGGMGSGLGQGQPADVLALGDQLWAIAADHGRLWRLDILGSVAVSERASTVTGPQLAGLPDGSGFFMSDPARRTVLYFAPTGEPLAQLGYADTFENPMGVAATFGEDGFVNLLVGDSAACTLSLWRLRTQ